MKYLFTLFIISAALSAQTDSLRIRIEKIASQAKGDVGVAVFGVEKNISITLNGEQRFPMQSVYKFPVALAVLNAVDKGLLSLDQRIFIKKEEMLPKTWSPLREKYPLGDTAVSLDEIVRYTVSLSDNVGCDVLFRLLGGPGSVDQFIKGLGLDGIAVRNTEQEMGKDSLAQYRNYSTPAAMAQLLTLTYTGKILSAGSTAYLMKILEETTTGPKRLKGLLPKGTNVAHKTGSSGTNSSGITAATNDAGIITLPNGTHVAVVVFVSNSSAEEIIREEVIAKIAKAVWDQYSIQ